MTSNQSLRLRPMSLAEQTTTERLLGWVALTLPLLLLFALAFALATAMAARAEDDPACGARDRIALLEKSDPAAYHRLVAEGAKIRNSEARFWKVEKPGQPANWLLGTMHLSDPRVTSLPEAAKAAFAASRTVILESDEILNQQAASAKLMARPDLMFFTGEASLKDYLSAEDEKALETGLEEKGITLASVIKMKPWIVSSMVALSSCELARKAGGAAFLDMKLAQDGLADGKQVKGVETLAEQIEAMASLPMDFHVRALVAATRYPDYTADMMETTLGLYLSGRIGMVFPASLYFAPEQNTKDFADMALFEEKLITRRNHTMAERAAPILAGGNVFMAVGALHLVGDEGVVELLRKQGYTLTAINEAEARP